MCSYGNAESLRDLQCCIDRGVGHAQQELLPPVAIETIVGSHISVQALRGGCQYGIARNMPVSVIDLFEAVDVNHRKAAMMHAASHKCLLLTQVGKQAGTVACAGERIAVVCCLDEFVSQGLQLQAKPVEYVVELIEIVGGDRQFVGDPLQKVRSAAVHLLVRLTDRDERGVVAKETGGVAVVPLAEATTTVCVGHQIGRIRG